MQTEVLDQNNNSYLWRRFKLAERATNPRREFLAGLTTFATMAYVLAVNPAILAETDMARPELLTATALAAGLFSMLMGWMANLPIAQAPGMGANALFAYTLVLSQGMPWQGALGLVFWSGLIFLLLTVTGIRQILLNAFPKNLKHALTVGIGLFIAFIGVKNAGLVATAPEPLLLSLGDLAAPGLWLALGGLAITIALMQMRITGAILIGIILLTGIGLFISDGGQPITTAPEQFIALPELPMTIFAQLDLTYVWTHFSTALPGLLTLVFLDLFSSLVAMNAMCNRAGLVDANGDMRNPKLGLSADALATMGASVLGTSTTNVYAESSAGIESGGRSGLTAVWVGVFFLLALFLSPLLLIIPVQATAPALIIIGVLMFSEVRQLDFTQITMAAPAVVTIFLMPITSITDGIAIGLVLYTCTMLLSGRGREVNWLSYVLAVVFICYYVFAA
ncbi:MAG: NCS2 family permease [Pseudomonadota bacterium]